MNAPSSRLATLPPPLAGLALGLLALAGSWSQHAALPREIWYATALLSVVMLAAIKLKYFCYRQLFWQDLKHPLIGSVLPTFSMTMMLLSVLVRQWSLTLGDTLWLAALALHLLLLVGFLFHRKDLSLSGWIPSWFIPTVGIMLAAATVSDNPKWLPVADFSLAIGSAFFALMLPFMLVRLARLGPLPAPVFPTIVILAAPASLLLESYFHITPYEEINPAFVILVGALAVVMTLLTYVVLPKLFKLPFSPAMAATTFPLVISANALFSTADWVTSLQATQVATAIHTFAWVQLVIATLVTAWVSGRFARALLMRP